MPGPVDIKGVNFRQLAGDPGRAVTVQKEWGNTTVIFAEKKLKKLKRPMLDADHRPHYTVALLSVVPTAISSHAFLRIVNPNVPVSVTAPVTVRLLLHPVTIPVRLLLHRSPSHHASPIPPSIDVGPIELTTQFLWGSVLHIECCGTCR